MLAHYFFETFGIGANKSGFGGLLRVLKYVFRSLLNVIEGKRVQLLLLEVTATTVSCAALGLSLLLPNDIV